MPIEVGEPFQMVGVDIVGPMKISKKGNRYILVVVDLFTKWAEAYPLNNIEAITITETLVSQFISRYGIPVSILADRGTQFESRIFAQVCELLQIEKKRTTPYHPQGNGVVEKTNGTLLQLIRNTAQ